ncbi:uncharacterized protein DUF2732 [Pantoea ananatis]|uniref:DUF2732 family protein n=1 Tax=Pantoea ananas TaxID=553 RepID=UPI000DC2F0A9|nr:DUF2732 family protein [Pantoea ananatis]RAR67412.1 uncharacterized protein DUF2732 [Pantoea ananatis]
MINTETRNFEADAEALNALLSKAKTEQRSDDALAVSVRIAKLVIHARKNEMTAPEIIELLDKEAERFEHEARELH